MKRSWTMVILMAVPLVLSGAHPAAGAEPTADAGTLSPVRTALPNDVGIELLGRAIIYNFSYQRMLTPVFGLEASVAGLGSGSSDSGSGGLLFGSLGGRFYFTKKDASPFVTAGGVGISASTDSGPFGSDHATASYGYAGAGFEFRSHGGFLFRGTAYGLMANGSYFIWPGLTAGYAF